MSDAKVKPIIKVWKPPRCGATRQESYANDTADTDFQCKWSGTVEITAPETGGATVALCRKHAGQVALAILERQTREMSAVERP